MNHLLDELELIDDDMMMIIVKGGGIDKRIERKNRIEKKKRKIYLR